MNDDGIPDAVFELLVAGHCHEFPVVGWRSDVEAIELDISKVERMQGKYVPGAPLAGISTLLLPADLIPHFPGIIPARDRSGWAGRWNGLVLSADDPHRPRINAGPHLYEPWTAQWAIADDGAVLGVFEPAETETGELFADVLDRVMAACGDGPEFEPERHVVAALRSGEPGSVVHLRYMVPTHSRSERLSQPEIAGIHNACFEIIDFWPYPQSLLERFAYMVAKRDPDSMRPYGEACAAEFEWQRQRLVEIMCRPVR